MLICTIEGRAAIPIRALPFITEWTFKPLQIVRLFYDPDVHANATHQPPVALQLDATGTVAPVPATRWKRVLARVSALHRGAAEEPQLLEALPAGTFVWLDEFSTFYDDYRGNKPGDAEAPAAAGYGGWDENTQISPEESALIREGFEALQPTRAEQRNSRRQRLEDLGREIDAIVALARSRGLAVKRTAMPGQKADLIDVLIARDSSRRGRAKSTYFGDFHELGLRWSGGEIGPTVLRFARASSLILSGRAALNLGLLGVTCLSNP